MHILVSGVVQFVDRPLEILLPDGPIDLSVSSDNQPLIDLLALLGSKINLRIRGMLFHLSFFVFASC